VIDNQKKRAALFDDETNMSIRITIYNKFFHIKFDALWHAAESQTRLAMS
jgi:hypothetical protein